MHSQLILEYALKHGGGTFSQTGPYEPETGFFVAVKGKEQRVLILDSLTVSIYRLAHLTRENELLGLWFDGEEWFLDISEWFISEELARLVAINREQKTYWDCAKKEAITP